MKLWLLIYSLIFMAIGIIFVLPVGKVKGKSLTWWLFAIWGGASLELTLVIQPPLQRWWGATFGSSFSTGILQYLIVLLPIALISGLVQELLKGVPFMARNSLWVNKVLFDSNDWLNYALAIGFGFGVWEAIRLVAYPVSYLTSFLWLPVIERVMAIMFHVASTAFLAYGIKNKKSGLYYIIVSATHGLLNYPVFLVNAKLLPFNSIYYFGFTLAIAFYIVTLKLWKRV